MRSFWCKSEFIGVIALLITQAGCIPIPIPSAEPMPFKEESTSFIRTGVTTRDEIRKQLGPPVASRENGRVYVYLAPHRVGHTVLLVPGQMGGFVPLYSKAYEITLLIIQFDDLGVVTELDRVAGKDAETANDIQVSNPGYEISGGQFGWKYLQSDPTKFGRDYLVLLAPREVDEEAKRFHVPPDQCAIYYYRDLPWYKFPDQPPFTQNMIRVAVILDDVNMGDHDKSEYFYWLVRPGKHIVRSRDLDRRNVSTDSSISFECVAGQSYFIEQTWNSWHLPPHPIHGSMTQVDEGIGKQEIEKRRLVLASGPSDLVLPEGTALDFSIRKQAGVYCPNADLGHADAQRHIADIFYFGYGLKVDPIRAWVWYNLAATNGDLQAKKWLERVSTELTPEQLDQAKRQLAAWAPGQCMQELTQEKKEKTVQ